MTRYQGSELYGGRRLRVGDRVVLATPLAEGHPDIVLGVVYGFYSELRSAEEPMAYLPHVFDFSIESVRSGVGDWQFIPTETVEQVEAMPEYSWTFPILPEMPEIAEARGLLLTTMSELEISVRVHNALEDQGIHTLDELCQYSAAALLEKKILTKRGVKEVRELLRNLGLRLVGDP